MWYFCFIKTPVLIPACNEELNISATLKSLPSSLVEPLVAVNGSTDRTAVLAKEFGCQVIDLAEQGKLPAIQTALTFLGKQALGPVLILDADTRPVFPRQWHNIMTSCLDSKNPRQPQAVGGPVWFTGRTMGLRVLKSVDRIVRAGMVGSKSTAATYMSSGVQRAAQLGPSMGIKLGQENILQDLLALDHFWPSEDKAIAGIIIKNSGPLAQTIHPGALVKSPASTSFITLSESRKLGLQAGREEMLKRYTQRGAAGSIPFTEKIFSSWEISNT